VCVCVCVCAARQSAPEQTLAAAAATRLESRNLDQG